ncbi:hypothetical protein CU048_10170 [Beijerinckiaceae bacterium]|nr:hypothetical protein CU048_10170 [Beijerinckiaceae bacterium]
MSTPKSPEPSDQGNNKLPKCYWKATESFYDLKLSHWVEMALTIALLFVGIAQFTVYKRQASIMDEQTKISARQLTMVEAEQRPWISLDMQPEGPLTRDSNGWNFIVKYTINNVGKSPAFNVNFLATMIPIGDPQPTPPEPWGFSHAMPTKAVETAVETTCRDFEQGRVVGLGEIMFPSVPQNRRWKPHSNPIGPGFIPGFVIIACATYKFVGDPITHRTVRIFDLERRAYGQMIDLGAETTATDDLSFFPHTENGSRAD